MAPLHPLLVLPQLVYGCGDGRFKGVKVYSRTSPPVTTAHATGTASTKRLDNSSNWPGLGMEPFLQEKEDIRFYRKQGWGKKKGNMEGMENKNELIKK